jgi:NAD-dependent deacetylase
MALEPLVADAARRLRGARHVCVLTGAGISAESGIPTFRDALTGLWAQFRPEDLATPEAFERDPALVWNWYESRRERVIRTEPNAGHYALVALAARVPKLTLVTQNVDSLHQRAGSAGVLEYHGNILNDRCTVEQVVARRAAGLGTGLPRCANCGALMRPDVVWFGESIPAVPLQLAAEAASDCDVFMSVGTSSVVYPAAGLIATARHHGAAVLEVNPNPTELSHIADVVLRGPAGRMLPELVAAFDALSPPGV